MMKSRDDKQNGPERCAACWEDIVSAARRNSPIPPGVDGHANQCPSCRDAAVDAGRLGEAIRGLSDRLDVEARQAASALSDSHAAELLVRFARYETWQAWSRRACAAGVAAAAGLAIIWSVLLGSGSGSPGRSVAWQNPDQGLALADRQRELLRETNLKDSPAGAAIPVEGWIDLPPSEGSADSSVWWVVLNYGGYRHK
jgi:hypothetical protein